MIRQILGLCARNQGHPPVYEQLSHALSTFRASGSSWDLLISEAERQGVAPLLYKHLHHINFSLPDNRQRILRSLCQRCRLANQIRTRAASEILESYQGEKIDVLVVKGMALSHMVYDSPELRPMRDIDLLVGEGDLGRAGDLLLDLGYQQQRSHAQLPIDYHHLWPVTKNIEGMPVTIELHRNLLPRHPLYPPWPLAKSYPRARRIQIGGAEADTLNLEDNLYYLYLHGFQAPLTYEEFRFVHIADIVSLVEKFFDQINWERMREEYAPLPAILSRFHFITPWPEEIVDKLKLATIRAPGKTGIPYRGWPKRKIRETPLTMLPHLLSETLHPGQWWLQVHYGHCTGAAYYRVRFFEHPRAVWRWVKAYARKRFAKPNLS